MTYSPSHQELEQLGFKPVSPGRYCYNSNYTILYHHPADGEKSNMPLWCMGEWEHRLNIDMVEELLTVIKVLSRTPQPEFKYPRNMHIVGEIEE